MKQYQHTTTARIYNRVISRLLRIGIPIGPMALLTVPGRRSGLPRSTPVALAPYGAGWQLVAAYGPVDWVKNLKAARRGTITMRGRRIPVTAQELPTAEAAPILPRQPGLGRPGDAPRDRSLLRHCSRRPARRLDAGGRPPPGVHSHRGGPHRCLGKRRRRVRQKVNRVKSVGNWFHASTLRTCTRQRPPSSH